MTKGRARKSAPAAAAQVALGGGLGEVIAADARMLGASAIAAGLGRLRPRSSPERLISEASLFVHYLSGALVPQERSWIERSAAAEVRAGSLASADAGEIGPVFALWRRVLRVYLPSAGKSGHERAILAALGKMEVASAAAAERWAGDRLDVVVIGASAGGIDALSKLLATLEANAPITLAVVQHIGANDRGLLPMLFARHSRLSIAAAVDGSRLFLGHAYIAPPGRHLVVARDSLHVVDGPPVHFVKPAADVLFESAAEAFGSRAASIVLSGTGRDGAAGTCAIREHGGLTFCQDPEDAEFRGMPEAAVATGRVDRTLSLGQLAAALGAAVQHGRKRNSPHRLETA